MHVQLFSSVLGVAAAASCLILVPLAASVANQTGPGQVFRAGVDIVEVQVNVVGPDGEPVADLAADDFDVRIGGQRRRVASVSFVRAGERDLLPVAAPPEPVGADLPLFGSVPAVPATSVSPEAMAGRRLFMIAVDALSFNQAEARGVAVATRRFVEQLVETDLVGLLTFPLGPAVDPTTEHRDVLDALDRLTGQRGTSTSRFPLQPSEIVDWMARTGERPPIIRRHCGFPAEPGCPPELALEIESLAATAEVQAQATLGQLGAVIDALAPVGGHKVVVLASAGLLMGDRPGARPDIGDLVLRLGETAARSNVTVYALYLDALMLRQFSAEQRFAPRRQVNVARESDILGRWLDQFSGAAGGTMIKVMVDSGDAAYRRIARETSAHYVLAVEPDASDRLGTARRIEVRVRVPSATVRAREWVVLPRN